MLSLIRKLEALNENDALEIVDLIETRYRAQEEESKRQFEEWCRQCETSILDESGQGQLHTEDK